MTTTDPLAELFAHPLSLTGGAKSVVAVTSLPWPAAEDTAPAAEAAQCQAVPLFDPTASPRLKRFLLITEAQQQALPERLFISRGAAAIQTQREEPNSVRRKVLREGETPFYFREEEYRLQVAGREIGLRLGLEFENGARAWWQWGQAECLWSGPLAQAWRICGHIPTHPVDRPPSIPAGMPYDTQMIEYGGLQIVADAFVILFRCGLVRLSAHFKNNFFHMPPRDVPGLPVIALTDLRGGFAPRTLTAAAPFSETGTPPHLLIDGGAGDALDLSASARFFSPDSPGRLTPLADGGAGLQPAGLGLVEDRGLKTRATTTETPFGAGVVLRPFDHIEVVAREQFGERTEATYVGGGVRDGLPAGVNRTVRLDVALNGVEPRIGRYQVPPQWYGLCGALNGRSQPAVAGKAHQWAAFARQAIYRSTHVGGFDTGRTTRFMHQKTQDESEWEGGTAQALFLDAYVDAGHADWDLVLHQAYHFADVAVHHGYDIVRCHGYNEFHGPLPMQRVGGLTLAYVETGDPYLLETARAVADRFFHVEWGSGPRYSVGRDAYPVATILTLYDYTGEKRYWDFSRQVLERLLRTQWPEGGFSGQGGCGLIAGRSNKQSPRDIYFASGLLAPMALLEWAIRAPQLPANFQDAIGRWYELALSLQLPTRGWPQPGGSVNYPLISAAHLFTLAACGRVLQDRRGLEAMDRYLDYALAHQEKLAGVHGFVVPLHAAFFDMEWARTR